MGLEIGYHCTSSRRCARSRKVLVQVHESSDAFFAACSELLFAKIAMHQLIIRAAFRPTSTDSPPRLLLSVHDHRGKAEGALVLGTTPNKNVAGPTAGTISKSAAVALLDTAARKNRDLLDALSMFMGSLANCEAL